MACTIDPVLEMKFRCESITPRGLPVDPELNSSAARSSPPPREPVQAGDASSRRVRVEGPEKGVGPGSSSTTWAALVSHFAAAGARRFSTKAKRMRVRSATAWQSFGVSPGEKGTATQPARIAPSQAATQKREFSATIPMH